MLHAFPSSPSVHLCVCVYVDREGREGKGGWNRCLPRSVYGTHRHLVSSTGLQGRKGKTEWCERERERDEGGRVCDREETGVEWMKWGFCLGKRTCRKEE